MSLVTSLPTDCQICFSVLGCKIGFTGPRCYKRCDCPEGVSCSRSPPYGCHGSKF